MKIADLQEKTHIEQWLLVSFIKRGVTAAGSPYLSITFRDNTGEIEGKLWDVKPQQEEILKVGKVVDVTAETYLYGKNLQAKVLKVEEVDQSLVDLAEFVANAPVKIDELKDTINRAIEDLDNFEIKAIVTALYNRYDQQIYSSPAATRNHHAFYGGLAMHVSGMVKLAYAVCELYPYLNRDLLVAGVLLHDLGKTIELSNAAVSEYTVEGKLLGHISISASMIQETANELGIDGEVVTLLRHMVLAHHGTHEFGSPVLPELIEAEALHYIDDFDAKMFMINKELGNIRPGEFTSRIFALDNRSFYRPKNQG